jgi:Transglycosylase SLT domain
MNIGTSNSGGPMGMDGMGDYSDQGPSSTVDGNQSNQGNNQAAGNAVQEIEQQLEQLVAGLLNDLTGSQPGQGAGNPLSASATPGLSGQGSGAGTPPPAYATGTPQSAYADSSSTVNGNQPNQGNNQAAGNAVQQIEQQIETLVAGLLNDLTGSQSGQLGGNLANSGTTPGLSGMGSQSGQGPGNMLYASTPPGSSGQGSGAGTPPPAYSAGTPPPAYSASPSGSAAPSGNGALGPNVPSALKPFVQDINAAAKQTGVPASLIGAQILQESGGNPNAVTKNPALGLPDTGLMQVDQATFQGLQQQNPDLLGGKSVSDPATNIMAGALLDKQLLDKNNGNIGAALTAYNGSADPSYVNEVTSKMNALQNGTPVPGGFS